MKRLIVILIIFILFICWTIFKSGGAFIPRVEKLEGSIPDFITEINMLLGMKGRIDILEQKVEKLDQQKWYRQKQDRKDY